MRTLVCHACFGGVVVFTVTQSLSADLRFASIDYGKTNSPTVKRLICFHNGYF
jgi:hypothetical protein